MPSPIKTNVNKTIGGEALAFVSDIGADDAWQGDAEQSEGAAEQADALVEWSAEAWQGDAQSESAWQADTDVEWSAAAWQGDAHAAGQADALVEWTADEGDAQSESAEWQADADVDWSADACHADGEWTETPEWDADASWSPGCLSATTTIGEEARAGGGIISVRDSPATSLSGLLPGGDRGRCRRRWFGECFPRWFHRSCIECGQRRMV